MAEDNWITNSSDFIESTDKENYSVVITLEHEKEKVKMYNQVKQRVLERIRAEEQEEVRIK